VNEFKPVTLLSNWGYWDQLDGTALRDAELIEVQYPDGTIEQGLVEVDRTPITVGDMGSGYRTESCSAFITYDLHGARVRLGLRGMMARRVVA